MEEKIIKEIELLKQKRKQDRTEAEEERLQELEDELFYIQENSSDRNVSEF